MLLGLFLGDMQFARSRNVVGGSMLGVEVSTGSGTKCELRGGAGPARYLAGLCCKKPRVRRLKQRFGILLLRSGRRSSQAERCPADLAWLLVPGVGCDPHQGLTARICPWTQPCPLPAWLDIGASRGT